MTEVPTCKCHGEPMRLHGNGKRGMGWRCIIKIREKNSRYAKTEKGLKVKRAAGLRYKETEKGRKTAENSRRRNGRRRVFIGADYIGMIPVGVDVDAARAHLRAKIDEHRQQQAQETEEFNESLKTVA